MYVRYVLEYQEKDSEFGSCSENNGLQFHFFLKKDLISSDDICTYYSKQQYKYFCLEPNFLPVYPVVSTCLTSNFPYYYQCLLPYIGKYSSIDLLGSSICTTKKEAKNNILKVTLVQGKNFGKKTKQFFRFLKIVESNANLNEVFELN